MKSSLNELVLCLLCIVGGFCFILSLDFDLSFAWKLCFGGFVNGLLDGFGFMLADFDCYCKLRDG